MAKKPETLFKERIRPLLEMLPRSWWVKTQMVAFMGIPDFLGCLNGHFIALELKKDAHSHCSELQKWVLSKIIRAGGLGLEVCPENWDKTYKTLVQIGLGKMIFQPEPPPPAEDLDS